VIVDDERPVRIAYLEISETTAVAGCHFTRHVIHLALLNVMN